MNQAKGTGRVSDTSDSNVTPMRRHPRAVTTADVRDARTALRPGPRHGTLAALGAPHRQQPGEDITVIIGRTAPCAAGCRGATAASIKAISSLME